MAKGNNTNRRGSRPTRPYRPYKPIPVVTEQYRGKTLTDAKVKQSLIERLKEWGGRIRQWFGRGKRRTESIAIQSKWRGEKRPQWAIDRGIRKSRIKTSNRRKRKQTRAMHQLHRVGAHA